MAGIDIVSEYERRKLNAGERISEYKALRAFFSGDSAEWWNNNFYKADRVNMTLNYVRPIVRKAAHFLVGDPPEFSVSPRSGKKDDLEASSKVERIIYGLLRSCFFNRCLMRVAQDSALLGTGWMKVYVEPNAEREPKTVRISYCRPEYVFPQEYKSFYDERIYDVIYAYQLPLSVAQAEYGKNIGPDSELESGREGVPEDVATYIEYWSEDRYALVVGNNVIEDTENPYGFIPIVPFPWFAEPGSVFGSSLVADIVDVNVVVNVLESRRADAAIMHCNAPLKYMGARVTSREEFINDMDGGVHFLPQGSDLQFLTWPGEAPTIEDSRRALMRYIHDATFIPEAAFSSGQVLTGIAWRMGFDPMVKMIHEVRSNWELSLKEVIEGALALIAKFFKDREVSEFIYLPPKENEKKKKGAPIVIKGEDASKCRGVEVIWRDVMPRDDISMARFELEKLSANAQSLWTTMERLGIPQPDEEMERMKIEFTEPAFRPRERAMQQISDAKALLALTKAAFMNSPQEISPLGGFGPMEEREALVPGEPGRPEETPGNIGPTPEQEAQGVAYPGPNTGR